MSAETHDWVGQLHDAADRALQAAEPPHRTEKELREIGNLTIDFNYTPDPNSEPPKQQ